MMKGDFLDNKRGKMIKGKYTHFDKLSTSQLRLARYFDRIRMVGFTQTLGASRKQILKKDIIKKENIYE